MGKRITLQRVSCWVLGSLLGLIAALSEAVAVDNAIHFSMRLPFHILCYAALGIAFIHFGRKTVLRVVSGTARGRGDVDGDIDDAAATADGVHATTSHLRGCFSRIQRAVEATLCNTTRKGFITLWTVLWLAWLPYLALLYPGIIWFDTLTQLLQMNGLPNVISSGQITDHHPVFDSLIFNVFVQLGNVVHSGNFGVFLYTLVQSLVTTCAMTYMLKTWHSTGASLNLVTWLYVIIAIVPFIPIFSIGMVKDSLFIPVFLLFFTHCSLIICKKIKLSKWLICAVILESVLMVLTKKTGMYIVVLTAVIALVTVHGKQIKALMAGMLVSAVLVQVVLTALIFPAFHIAPGGKQEMLAVPFMQASRVVTTVPNVDPEFKRAVTDLLGDDVASRYVQFNGDYIKGNSWNSEKQAHLHAFMQQWARGITLYPKAYLEAWLGMESSWFTLPHAQIPQEWKNAYLMQVYAEGTTFDASSQQFEEFARAKDLGLSNNDKRFARLLQDIILWINETALGSTLFSRALWTTWMTALLFSFVFVRWGNKRQRLTYGVAIIPFIVSYLFLWVTSNSGSIEAMRYAMSVVFGIPVVLCLLSVLVQERETVKRACE